MATREKSTQTGSTKLAGKKGGPQSGSPITIGGGGGEGEPKTRRESTYVGCSFNHKNYKDQNDPTGTSPKKRKFEHPGWRMRTLVLEYNSGQLDFTSLLPADGKCTVLVKCGGDSNTGLRIKIHGNPLGIEFHTGYYPPDSSDPNNHYNKDPTYISKVEIDAENLNVKKEFFAGDSCRISTDYLQLTDARTKSRKAKR